MVEIHHHTVAQRANYIGVQNTGGQQIQHERSLIRHYGMSGVVAALITDDNIRLLCQKVNDPAFPLIAPVDSCYSR